MFLSFKKLTNRLWNRKKNIPTHKNHNRQASRLLYVQAIKSINNLYYGLSRDPKVPEADVRYIMHVKLMLQLAYQRSLNVKNKVVVDDKK